MPLIDNVEQAIRLAKAIASDIAIYHEHKIVEGIIKDNLFESMAAIFEEGRKLYKQRIKPEIDPNANLFDRAIVDVILKSKANVRSKIW
ncbi:MAG: hypothetical protein N3B13_01845 [Deltaproteobacteria bacterium]|nr:hypothetical protein [Deltaproteobacteria bacterium]